MLVVAIVIRLWWSNLSAVVSLQGVDIVDVGGGHCCSLVVVKPFSCCFSLGEGHCCSLVVVKFFSNCFSLGGRQ